jgi:tetratricopeptide (TPR) repeat protein
VLESLARAASDGLSRAERELWSALARVLSVKREPGLALKFLEPLARTDAPWPELERAVAQAYAEFDMPAEALVVLERMAGAAPYDLALRLDAASAARMLGDHAREVQWLRAAAAIQPGRTDIERQLGIALVRLGDPDGRRLVREALLRDPDDAELEPFLGPGPYPAPERGYSPNPAPGHEHAHEEEH